MFRQKAGKYIALGLGFTALLVLLFGCATLFSTPEPPTPEPSLVDVKKAAETYLGTDTALWVYRYMEEISYGNVVLMARETTQNGTFDAWVTVRHMYKGNANNGYSYSVSEYRTLGGAYDNKFFVLITRPTRFNPFVNLSAHPDPLPWEEIKVGQVLWRVGWGLQYQDDQQKFSPHIDFGEITSLNDPTGQWSIAYSASGEFGLSGSLVLYYEDSNKDGVATPNEFWYVGLHNGQKYVGNTGTLTAWATYGYPEAGSLVTVPLHLSHHFGWNVVSFSKELGEEEVWEIIQKAIKDFDNVLTKSSR